MIFQLTAAEYDCATPGSAFAAFYKAPTRIRAKAIAGSVLHQTPSRTQSLR
jgi:hypothetical protein